MTCVVSSSVTLALRSKEVRATVRRAKTHLFVVSPVRTFVPPSTSVRDTAEVQSVLEGLTNVTREGRYTIVLIKRVDGNKSGALCHKLNSVSVTTVTEDILVVSESRREPNVQCVCPVGSDLTPRNYTVKFSFGRNNNLR